MKYTQIDSILERINRISNRAKNIQGDGEIWSYTFDDGNETTYALYGLKPLIEIEDDILNMFIWFWSFKDYLKEVASLNGIKPSIIEKLVNNDIKLAICADIANFLKHGVLSTSRSGKYPSLDRISYTIPQKSIKQITFSENAFELDTQNIKNIKIKLAVRDKNGGKLGQALDLLEYSIGIWEKQFALLKQKHNKAH